MDVWAVQPMETRRLFLDERAELLAVLEGLAANDWAAASPAPEWTVKDVALHLLDGDLSRLSRARDGDPTGVLPKGGDSAALAGMLAVKNRRWIEATRYLSGRVIHDLLAHSTAELEEWTARTDLRTPSSVSWASDEPVPAWLDLARELTETWVHHQQIRAAVGQPTSTSRLPTVLRTFVWALPHQYRVLAEPGTTVAIDLDAGGRWLLLAEDTGRWSLHEDANRDADASVSFTSDAAWRSFTGAALPTNSIRRSGPDALTEPVLKVRGIIA
jgi:uncharacterized protein (TIGR03083 family)